MISLFIAYLLVSVGFFIGTQSENPGSILLDTIVALSWPIILVIAILIQLGIVKP